MLSLDKVEQELFDGDDEAENIGDIVRELLYGKDSSGDTPLHIAGRCKHFEIYREMVRKSNELLEQAKISKTKKAGGKSIIPVAGKDWQNALETVKNNLNETALDLLRDNPRY
jgi:ankyrin repeat protein